MRILSLVLLISGTCVAAPFVPADPKTVLEKLPEAPAGSFSRELRQLRRELARDPENLALATRVARGYIQRARAEADPRYLGYAQAALAPWWGAPSPAVVLVLRATIRQSLHDFPSALADLSAALEIDPRNAQALLTRATIRQVRGEFGEALESCRPLERLAGELVATACWAGAAGMSGQSEVSYERLRETLARQRAVSPGVRQWVLTSLAEMAERQGKRRLAEAHFKEALATGEPDAYLKGAYADLLLDEERHAEVVALLRNELRADTLLLRLTLAEQKLGLPRASEHVEALKARFSASRMRGDSLHRREEARFALHVLRAPNEALRLAQENWSVHREPWDARIYLEAALAAGNSGAARPVLDWLRANRVQDVKLAALAQQAAR
jgi:tetratricopeptide (TPR) repeat protein